MANSHFSCPWLLHEHVNARMRIDCNAETVTSSWHPWIKISINILLYCCTTAGLWRSELFLKLQSGGGFWNCSWTSTSSVFLTPGPGFCFAQLPDLIQTISTVCHRILKCGLTMQGEKVRPPCDVTCRWELQAETMHVSQNPHHEYLEELNLLLFVAQLMSK